METHVRRRKKNAAYVVYIYNIQYTHISYRLQHKVLGRSITTPPPPCATPTYIVCVQNDINTFFRWRLKSARGCGIHFGELKSPRLPECAIVLLVLAFPSFSFFVCYIQDGLYRPSFSIIFFFNIFSTATSHHRWTMRAHNT